MVKNKKTIAYNMKIVFNIKFVAWISNVKKFLKTSNLMLGYDIKSGTSDHYTILRCTRLLRYSVSLMVFQFFCEFWFSCLWFLNKMQQQWTIREQPECSIAKISSTKYTWLIRSGVEEYNDGKREISKTHQTFPMSGIKLDEDARCTLLNESIESSKYMQ